MSTHANTDTPRAAHRTNTTRPAHRATAALVTFALATSLLAALPASLGDGTDPVEFQTIQDAIDAAAPGDTVIARASSNPDAPTPFLESVTIDKEGLTLCSAAPAATQDPGPVFLGTPADCETGHAAAAVIDASTKGTHVIEILANDVTVTGFTLRWVVNTEQVAAPGAFNPADLINQVTGMDGGIRGVVVNADNATIDGNQIRIRVGPAPIVASSPSPVPGTGIVIPPGTIGTTVRANDLRVIRGTEGTIGGMWGIVASGNDYLIEDNTISQWAAAGILVTGMTGPDASVIRANTITENGLYGIHLSSLDTVPAVEGNTVWIEGDAAIFVDQSDNAIIEGNALVPGLAGGSGVWVRGSDDVQLLRNEFGTIPGVGQQTGFPVTVSAAATGLVLRENVFRLDTTSANRIALHVASDMQLTHIDARLNDWSVCTWGDVSARVVDAGLTNTIDLTPFVTTEC